VNVEEQDLRDAVRDITGGDMADLVIDCASGGPATVVSAIYVARKSGRIILGGRKFKTVPEFNSDLLITRFLTVKGMRGHSYQSVELALSIIAGGKYPLERMCTHVFPLAETDRALRTVGGEGEPGAIHVAVDPWGDGRPFYYARLASTASSKFSTRPISSGRNICVAEALGAESNGSGRRPCRLPGRAAGRRNGQRPTRELQAQRRNCKLQRDVIGRSVIRLLHQ